MATFRFDALGRAPERLRNWIDRARKSAVGRSAPARLGLLAVLAGALAAVGWLALWSFSPADRVYLASGRALRPDDQHKVERALQSQGIEYKLEDRRVSVAGSAAAAAEAVVVRLALGPRSPEELRDAASGASFLESLRDKEERLQRDRAKLIESLIDDLPGVEDSYVSIIREKTRGGVRPTIRSSAFVKVQAEGGRELTFSNVEAIVRILAGNEVGLKREHVTIMDRTGRCYLDAGNPELTALSTDRAREEEVSRRIHDQLDWIDDVRITVRIDEPPAVVPAPVPIVVVEPSAPSIEGLSVGLNRAMEIEADEELAPDASLLVPVPAPAPQRRRGEVFVRVPHSYYYRAGRTPEGGPASREGNAALMRRVEQLVSSAVRLVAADFDGIDWQPAVVEILPGEIPENLSTTAVAGASRRAAREWILAGGAGAAAAAIVAVGTWIFGSRQPSRRTAPQRGGLRYHRGSPGTPAPTERVLEFVRRNPETAFSVLSRWTTQGGGRS